MTPFKILLLISALAVSACAAPPLPSLGPDGRPLPQVYKIGSNDTERVQITMIDAVNSLRSAAGAGPLRYDASLNAAAATHSRDMSIQNRPWHFGSDGSSPIDRVRRAGYGGMMLGENISETYETELETLAAWLEDRQTKDVLLDPRAVHMGFAWFQEDNGKIWWTLLTGR